MAQGSLSWYFCRLLGTWSIFIVPRVARSQQHPKEESRDDLKPSAIARVVASLDSLSQHEPTQRDAACKDHDNAPTDCESDNMQSKKDSPGTRVGIEILSAPNAPFEGE